jgi:glycosyltransferase involved in cell wall biosynthesis
MRQTIKNFCLFSFHEQSIPILPIDFTNNNSDIISPILENLRPIFNIQVGGFNVHAEFISRRIKTFLWTTTALLTPTRYARVVSVQDRLFSASEDALVSAGLDPSVYEKIFSLGTHLEGQNLFKYRLLPKTHLGLEPDSFVIAVVGNRLEFEISIDELAFFKRLLHEIKTCRILFIGALPKEALENIQSALGVRALFLGYVEDLQSIYASCDVFVNTRRLGGGMCAYLALYSGILVYSINYGDVSNLIPTKFQADSYDRLTGLITKKVNHDRNESLRMAHQIVRGDESLTSKVRKATELLNALE